MYVVRLIIPIAIVCGFSAQAMAGQRLEEVVVSATRIHDGGSMEIRTRDAGLRPDGLNAGGSADADAGGGSSSQVVDITNTTNGLRIKFVEFDFAIEISAEDFGRLTASERTAFISVLTRYSESPQFAAVLKLFDSQGVSSVAIHFGDKVYNYDGSTRSFEMVTTSFGKDGEAGFVAYATLRSTGNLEPGSTISISINEEIVKGPKEFANTLIHEMLHPAVPGNDREEESEVRRQASDIYEQIFKKSGVDELEQIDGSSSVIGVIARGTANNDILYGSLRNDAINGGSGNDQLYGYDGDDFIAGEEGSDTLHGGGGNNRMDGGLGEDTYVSTGWRDLIIDEGGYDRVVMTDTTYYAASFERVGDSLRITAPSGRVVEIDRYWIPQYRVEYFQFADRTYAASEIDAIFNPPPMPACYNNPPRICDWGTVDN